jgi:hypothetical protein
MENVMMGTKFQETDVIRIVTSKMAIIAAIINLA